MLKKRQVFFLLLAFASLNAYAQNALAPGEEQKKAQSSLKHPVSSIKSPSKGSAPSFQKPKGSALKEPTQKQTPLKVDNSKPSTSETPILDSFLSGNAQNNTNTAPISTPEMPSAWGPFFFLLIVAIVVYYLIKYFKKRFHLSALANNPVSFIRTVASVPVTPQASIAIVEIGEKYFLLSVTSHSMSVLDEVTDKEIIYQIKLIEENKGRAKNFKEIISSLFHVKVEKKIKPDISPQSIQDFVQKQKDRLDKLNEK
jgi:flagellar biosynthetic protein FliO